jgi:hypothetical protein
LVDRSSTPSFPFLLHASVTNSAPVMYIRASSSLLGSWLHVTAWKTMCRSGNVAVDAEAKE